MIIKFGVDDNSDKVMWPALTLNWASKSWQLTDDKAGSWSRVTAAKAGKFEYNFHDSEFLMLFLVIVTIALLNFAITRWATRRSVA